MPTRATLALLADARDPYAARDGYAARDDALVDERLRMLEQRC